MVEKSSWQEIIPNEIWSYDNFLPDDVVEMMLTDIDSAKEKTLDGNDYTHIFGATYYNYNVLNELRQKTIYKDAVIDRLNIFYKSKFNLESTKDNLTPLQFFFKTFNPAKSKYDLHTENPNMLGPLVFMLYLSNEVDGALVIPNREQCQPLITEGFKEQMQHVDVRFVGPYKILPKKNTCIVMNVGIAHLVEPCSGSRPCVTGWSFASNDYMNKWGKVN